MKIKIFTDENPPTLEEKVNDYIKHFNNADIQIQYQHVINEVCDLFSVMLIIKVET